MAMMAVRGARALGAAAAPARGSVAHAPPLISRTCGAVRAGAVRGDPAYAKYEPRHLKVATWPRTKYEPRRHSAAIRSENRDTYSMELSDGTRKRTRASDGGGGSSADGPDRLSALPDCLLHVIMSSLKARQVVQTCVLSTRWRHLWRSVPCLDVDIVEFRTKAATPGSSSGGSASSSDSDDDSDSDSDNNQEKCEGWDKFEDFTVNLMLRCNISLLDSFRLDIDRGSKPYDGSPSSAALIRWAYSGRQAAAWLRRAMKYCTPGSGHTISQRQGLNLSSSWRLKRLHLCYVPLDDCFAEHFSLVCRSLEDLELDHCICDCEIRSIASDSLKNLVLKHCRWGGLYDIASPTLKTLVICGGYNEGYRKPLAISAPMVAYLRLDVSGVCFRGGIWINEKAPYLDRASIHLRWHKRSLSKSMGGSKLGGDQSELLCGLSNVTSLELLGVGTTVLGKEPKFLEFQNLRNLLLGDCDLSDDFRILRFFHRGSPNLEKVTLRHCKFPDYSGCCSGLDFLSDKNVELEIIHEEGDACPSAGELVRHLPNVKGTTDAVPDAAAAPAPTEDPVPHSTRVRPRRGTRRRTNNVRISGPEWE